jgi:enamine deaminase RidA (YjgF/YER057c/UK114 family)
MIEYFRTPIRSRHLDLPPDATIVPSSTRTVWLSGVQSWDGNETPFAPAVGPILGVGDPGEQVRVTMRNIEAILAELGGSLADLVRAVIYVITDDDANLDNAWAAYVKVMGDRQPATTLLGVTRLGHEPGQEPLVEIEVTAALA